MSATESAQPPASNATHAAATVPPSSSVGRRSRISLGRLLALAAAVALVAVAFVPVMSWIEYRRNHSITDDVFVEAHIVNVAPQLVSGRLMRYHVDENDQVVQGQVVAEIDPYHTRIRSTSPGLSSSRRRPSWPASEPTWTGSVKKCRFRSRSPDARSPLPEPTRPRQRKRSKLTRDEVEKGIDEARAGVKAAQASLKLAEMEYARFTRLEQQGASTLQRQQQMTQSRDSALAQVDLNQARLAKAVASLTQIDVARRTLEAAQKSALKAQQVSTSPRSATTRSASWSCWSRSRSGESNKRGVRLEAAESDLEYTKIRAPFPGIVVKRYRHLGDYSPAGSPLLSMYNPDLLYMEANLEEDRLPGVEPGNPVHIKLDAFPSHFEGGWSGSTNRPAHSSR